MLKLGATNQMKKLLVAFLSLLALASLAGCGSATKSEKTPAKSAAQIVLPFGKSLEKAGIKGSLTLAKKPERVVSLTNTPVLTLEALGVNQVGIPDTKILQWPDSLKKKAKLFQTGMRSNIDIESVIALQPDLVIVGYHAKDTYGKILEREKIPVYYVDAGPTVSYASVKEMTLTFVDAFGKDTEAGKAIQKKFADVEQQMAEEKKKNAGKKVMVMQAAPPRFYLQNKFGTVGSMLNLLGYTNVAPEKGGIMVPMDQEKALSYDPDLIVCVSAMAGENEQKGLMEKEFADHQDYWSHFKAIRAGKVIYLPKTFAVSGGLDEIDQIQNLIGRLHALEKGQP